MKRNFLIIILAVLLLGSVVTCNLINADKIYGCNNTPHNSAVSIDPIPPDEGTILADPTKSTSDDTQVSTEVPMVSPANQTESEQTPEQDNTAAPVQTASSNENQTSLPTSDVPVTNTPSITGEPTISTTGTEQASATPIVVSNTPTATTAVPTYAQTNEPTATPKVTATARPTATAVATAQATAQIIYSPYTITITSPNSSKRIIEKEQKSTSGKYVSYTKEVNGTEYTYSFTYKANGTTRFGFFLDTGDLKQPSYFYIYELVTNNGKITGEVVGEYAYSPASKGYVDVRNGRAQVSDNTIISLFAQYGITYTAPTPTPAPTNTPAPTVGNTQTPAPTSSPTTTPSITGAWKSITLSTTESKDKWILSKKYNNKLITTKEETGTHRDRELLFYDYKFTFTSKDVPGKTNVCMAYYVGGDLDTILVYKITIEDTGAMGFDKLTSLTRNAEGVFEDEDLLNTLVEQFDLKMHL